MRGRFSFVLLVIFGSFCVYCAQNVTSGGNGGGSGNGGGGMVGNAGADTCCTPPDPPAGVVLFDQKFTSQTVTSYGCVSPAIDVSGYRTIVVHGLPYNYQIDWTFGGQVGWTRAPTLSDSQGGVNVLDGRLGKQFRVGYGGTCYDTALTVVGYKQ